ILVHNDRLDTATGALTPLAWPFRCVATDKLEVRYAVLDPVENVTKRVNEPRRYGRFPERMGHLRRGLVSVLRNAEQAFQCALQSQLRRDAWIVDHCSALPYEVGRVFEPRHFVEVFVGKNVPTPFLVSRRPRSLLAELARRPAAFAIDRHPHLRTTAPVARNRRLLRCSHVKPLLWTTQTYAICYLLSRDNRVREMVRDACRRQPARRRGEKRA